MVGMATEKFLHKIDHVFFCRKSSFSSAHKITIRKVMFLKLADMTALFLLISNI